MRRIALESSALAIELVPACGGKLVSLRDRRRDIEWLWSHASLRPRAPVYGESFIEGLDCGGWDEMFPSVVPCRVGGLMVPDHGDLASLGWEVTARDESSVEMRVVCRFAPVTFRRRIELSGGELRMDYSVRNDGEEPLPWTWFAHPLLRLDTGTRIEWTGHGPMQVIWQPDRPRSGREISAADLNRLLADPSARFAMKLASAPGEVEEAVVHRAGGGTLRFRWNTAEVPILALWVNRRGWSGTGGAPYSNLGVEPGMTMADSLAEAVAAGSAPQLPAGAEKCWQLQVAIG